ncbi:MAG: hypothetical protein RIS99_139 [Bacteroidota bacterium]|jgi:hypothetical protein
MRFYLFLFFQFIVAQGIFAQTIQVDGRVKSPQGTPITGNQVYIVNKTNGRFVVADAFGRFSIQLEKNEDLFVSCSGFQREIISFKDSTYKFNYQVVIKLSPLAYTLKPVYIPRRPVDEIRKEMQTLGVEKSAAAKLINPIENPISFLYYVFSKRERQKREIMELENQDRTRKLLKELLRLYVEEGLFFLPDQQFDAYLDRCPIPENFLKSASDYDLVARLKSCYLQFEEGK